MVRGVPGAAASRLLRRGPRVAGVVPINKVNRAERTPTRHGLDILRDSDFTVSLGNPMRGFSIGGGLEELPPWLFHCLSEVVDAPEGEPEGEDVSRFFPSRVFDAIEANVYREWPCSAGSLKLIRRG